MFRFYLREKVLAGESEDNDARSHPSDVQSDVDEPQMKSSRQLAQERLRNRRVLERFPIDNKLLTVMNDQDILPVRELSAGGFCAEVGPESFSRFQIGDVYAGRIRYLGENFDLRGRVAWKDSGFVGFEIAESGVETRSLLKRLLKPMEVASNLSEIDANFLNGGEGEKVWFHSDFGDDLVVWRDVDQTVCAWELTTGGKFVEWTRGQGIVTGTLAPKPSSLSVAGHSSGLKVVDLRMDPEKHTFAVDVIMALAAPIREELLPLVAGTASSH